MHSRTRKTAVHLVRRERMRRAAGPSPGGRSVGSLAPGADRQGAGRGLPPVASSKSPGPADGRWRRAQEPTTASSCCPCSPPPPRIQNTASCSIKNLVKGHFVLLNAMKMAAPHLTCTCKGARESAAPCLPPRGIAAAVWPRRGARDPHKTQPLRSDGHDANRAGQPSLKPTIVGPAGDTTVRLQEKGHVKYTASCQKNILIMDTLFVHLTRNKKAHLSKRLRGKEAGD